ncbi:U3 small nucleolar RNA-associated protein 12 [Cucumispora dikerogammari]|nr:U3 small nucleolar RNA-associated protein 12 [Cucumispora dikerogammari]
MRYAPSLKSTHFSVLTNPHTVSVVDTCNVSGDKNITNISSHIPTQTLPSSSIADSNVEAVSVVGNLSVSENILLTYNHLLFTLDPHSLLHTAVLTHNPPYKHLITALCTNTSYTCIGYNNGRVAINCKHSSTNHVNKKELKIKISRKPITFLHLKEQDILIITSDKSIYFYDIPSDSLLNNIHVNSVLKHVSVDNNKIYTVCKDNTLRVYNYKHDIIFLKSFTYCVDGIFLDNNREDDNNKVFVYNKEGLFRVDTDISSNEGRKYREFDKNNSDMGVKQVNTCDNIYMAEFIFPNTSKLTSRCVSGPIVPDVASFSEPTNSLITETPIIPNQPSNTVNDKILSKKNILQIRHSTTLSGTAKKLIYILTSTCLCCYTSDLKPVLELNIKFEKNQYTNFHIINTYIILIGKYNTIDVYKCTANISNKTICIKDNKKIYDKKTLSLHTSSINNILFFNDRMYSISDWNIISYPIIKSYNNTSYIKPINSYTFDTRILSSCLNYNTLYVLTENNVLTYFDTNLSKVGEEAVKPNLKSIDCMWKYLMYVYDQYIEIFELMLMRDKERMRGGVPAKGYKSKGKTILSSDNTPNTKNISSIKKVKTSTAFSSKINDKKVCKITINVPNIAFAKLSPTTYTNNNDSLPCIVGVSTFTNEFHLYDVVTGDLLHTLYGHTLPVVDFDIHVGNKIIITSSGDKVYRLYGLEYGEIRKRFVSLAGVTKIGAGENVTSVNGGPVVFVDDTDWDPNNSTSNIDKARVSAQIYKPELTNTNTNNTDTFIITSLSYYTASEKIATINTIESVKCIKVYKGLIYRAGLSIEAIVVSDSNTSNNRGGLYNTLYSNINYENELSSGSETDVLNKNSLSEHMSDLLECVYNENEEYSLNRDGGVVGNLGVWDYNIRNINKVRDRILTTHALSINKIVKGLSNIELWKLVRVLSYMAYGGYISLCENRKTEITNTTGAVISSAHVTDLTCEQVEGDVKIYNNEIHNKPENLIIMCRWCVEVVREVGGTVKSGVMKGNNEGSPSKKLIDKLIVNLKNRLDKVRGGLSSLILLLKS